MVTVYPPTYPLPYPREGILPSYLTQGYYPPYPLPCIPSGRNSGAPLPFTTVYPREGYITLLYPPTLYTSGRYITLLPTPLPLPLPCIPLGKELRGPLTLYHCIPSGRISRSYRRARKTDIIILTLATALTKATIKYIKNTKFLLISLRDNIRLHQCINNIISSIMM